MEFGSQSSLEPSLLSVIREKACWLFFRRVLLPLSGGLVPWLFVSPDAVLRELQGVGTRLIPIERAKKINAGRIVGRHADIIPADISITVQPTVRVSV